MADRNFLNQLAFFQANYRHYDTPIDDELFKAMDHLFTNIGHIVQNGGRDDVILRSSVVSSLREIAWWSFDALQADDYQALFADIIRLHEKKNVGYAGIGTKDPWANFRMSAWFGVDPFIGCLIRMSDKLIRIKNLSKNPNADQVGESVRDTLYDLAIYSVIAMCLWDENERVVLK